MAETSRAGPARHQMAAFDRAMGCTASSAAPARASSIAPKKWTVRWSVSGRAHRTSGTRARSSLCSACAAVSPGSARGTARKHLTQPVLPWWSAWGVAAGDGLGARRDARVATGVGNVDRDLVRDAELVDRREDHFTKPGRAVHHANTALAQRSGCGARSTLWPTSRTASRCRSHRRRAPALSCTCPLRASSPRR